MSIRISSVSSSTAEKKGMPLEWSPGGAAEALAAALVAALVAPEEGEAEEAAAVVAASAMAADESEAFGLTLEQEGPL